MESERGESERVRGTKAAGASRVEVTMSLDIDKQTGKDVCGTRTSRRCGACNTKATKPGDICLRCWMVNA